MGRGPIGHFAVAVVYVCGLHLVPFIGRCTPSAEEIAKYKGTDVSTENLADGFTHCFIVTFHSAKDRDAYLPHPSHKEFVKLVGPHVEKVLVVDFWVQK